MRKKIYTIIFLVGLLTLSGCDKDFDKINRNPNSPEKTLPNGLFNSANKEFIDHVRGVWSSGRLALPWVQYSAQTNYTSEDRFKLRETQPGSLWNSCYSVAQDYKTIIDLNTSDETKKEAALFGKNENQIAAARVMLAYVFCQLVESFGDVPYYSYGSNDPDFQALNTTKYITPVYASQEKIYEDILKELKEASEMIDETAPNIFVSGDALFKSPIRLKRFANSLRLRIANRVKGVIPSAKTHMEDAIKSGVMQSNADNIGLTYESNNENASPMYKGFFVDNRSDFAPSSTFVDLLKGAKGNFGEDPRMRKYFTPKGITEMNVKNASYSETKSVDEYVGMPYGIPDAYTASQYEGGKGISWFSSNILKPNYTEVLMEYAEVCFILSEKENWDTSKYEEGVKASMERWGVDGTKISMFINSLPPANEETVITQKYIALFMQPYEAWSEYRRTGYPNILLKVGEEANLNQPYTKEKNGKKEEITKYKFQSLVSGLTDIPGRIHYPNNYTPLNDENYKKALKNMGLSGDVLSGKLIWAK